MKALTRLGRRVPPGWERPLGRATIAEYMKLPWDNGKRYELLNGELYMTPAPTYRHQLVLMNLAALLHLHVKRTAAGSVVAAPTDVVLKPDSVCQPDILFISRGRAEIITVPNVQGAPDLAVEIRSPGTVRRDRVVKRAIYAESGVANLWFLDPNGETLEELILDATSREYSVRTTLSGRRGTFRSAIFPELAIRLSEVYWNVP